METTLTNALLRTDDLVWFYTEEFEPEQGEEGVGHWYVPGSMPEPWFDAVRAARETVAVTAEADPKLEARALAVYPNPSAGRAEAHVYLETSGSVRLAVVDLLGREVAVLANRAMAAGPHRLALDVQALPPGLYLVRLETEGTRADAASGRGAIAR